MKIYNNGVLVRDSKGRFSSFSKKVWRGCEYVICAVGILFFIGAYNGSKQEVFVPQAAAQEVKIIDRMPEKIEKLKDEVVNDLAGCESAGHSEDSGIIIFDTNNKASIGVLQFQKATVIHYVKVLYQKDITGQEAVELAINPIEAKKLAKDIIFKTNNGSWKDWVNCSNKLGLKARIEIIKELEK